MELLILDFESYSMDQVGGSHIPKFHKKPIANLAKKATLKNW